jgi:4-amino-4-deoxy-L-arabinose transferase-like glycosyltransferase
MIRDRAYERCLHLFLLIVLFIFSGYVFFKDLGKNTPFYPDESLYSLSDVRIFNNPSGILFPKPGKDLPNYYRPPLKTWMKYFVLKIFGFNGFMLRVLDGLMGLLTIGMIFLLGYRLFNKWIGIASGFIMLTFSGMYRDYWARVNAYDAGLVLGTAVFFYLFLFHYKKNLGWLWCGVALAFCFYFKHIMSFLLIFIAIIYLSATEGSKGILNRRFFLMLIIMLALILAWHIPCLLVHPEIIHTFIVEDIMRDFFVGSPSQQGYGNPMSPISYIWAKTGAWNILIIPGIIIALISFFLKRKKKLFILPLWFFIPLLVIMISATRLARYMFPFYPPMALMLGYSVVSLPYGLIRFKLKKSKLCPEFLRYTAFIALFVFLLLTVFKAVKLTFAAIEPFRRENFHVFADLYRNQIKGKIYIAEKNLSMFAWDEQVILEFIKDRIVFLENRQNIPVVFNKLGRDEALLLFRWELTNLIYSGKIRGLPLEDYSYIGIPKNTLKYHSTRKVAIFRSDSSITEFLKKSGIPVSNFKGQDSYNSKDNLIYISNLFSISIGLNSINQHVVQYYTASLSSGDLTRDELAQRCECYSKYFNYQILPVWSEKEDGLNQRKKGFHYLVDFYSSGRKGILFMFGVTRKDITENLYCYFAKTERLWQLIPCDYNLNSLLGAITSNDVILLKRPRLIEYLSGSGAESYGIIPNNQPLPNSSFSAGNSLNTFQYSFFTVKTYKGSFKDKTGYPRIVGIVKAGGALFAYLSTKGVQLFPLVPVNNLLGYSKKVDFQFIKRASSLILGGPINDVEALKLINDSKGTKTDRKKIINALLEKSRNFLDCDMEKSKDSTRKKAIQKK